MVSASTGCQDAREIERRQDPDGTPRPGVNDERVC